MSNIFTIVFFGVFFGILPIILFYGGIFITYLPYYNIKEYFNPFFISNVNIYFYILFGLFSGIAFFLKTNLLKYLYLLMSVLMLSTFIDSVGIYVGHRLLSKYNTTVLINNESMLINVIYKNDHKIYYNTNDNPQINVLNIK